MNIAYCEDEKIQLEYMEQLIKKWADEGNDTVTYFGYGSAKELLFEHPDSFPFDLLLLVRGNLLRPWPDGPDSVYTEPQEPL